MLSISYPCMHYKLYIATCMKCSICLAGILHKCMRSINAKKGADCQLQLHN